MTHLLLLLLQVSTRDHVIPVQMQFDLATKLKARTVTFPTGNRVDDSVMITHDPCMYHTYLLYDCYICVLCDC